MAFTLIHVGTPVSAASCCETEALRSRTRCVDASAGPLPPATITLSGSAQTVSPPGAPEVRKRHCSAVTVSVRVSALKAAETVTSG